MKKAIKEQKTIGDTKCTDYNNCRICPIDGICLGVEREITLKEIFDEYAKGQIAKLQKIKLELSETKSVNAIDSILEEVKVFCVTRNYAVTLKEKDELEIEVFAYSEIQKERICIGEISIIFSSAENKNVFKVYYKFALEHYQVLKRINFNNSINLEVAKSVLLDASAFPKKFEDAVCGLARICENVYTTERIDLGD